MNSFLLNRALGAISPQSLAKAQNTRLLHSLQPANDVTLSIKKQSNETSDDDNNIKRGVAHPAGVNSITIDKFEGR